MYSFGVVLVELLTGEKLVSLARSPEVRGLVAYFNFSMEENRLFDIVDAQVKEVCLRANLAQFFRISSTIPFKK